MCIRDSFESVNTFVERCQPLLHKSTSRTKVCLLFCSEILTENLPQGKTEDSRVGVNVSKYIEKLELEDIQEIITNLVDQMREFERNGKYIEAQSALIKIEEFKKEANRKYKEQLRSRHATERKEVEESHLAEFNQFNEFWDKKMEDFQSEAAKAENELLQRHHEETARFTDELIKSLPERPKDTSEILNMRKIEESLARQREYNC
eukprot:TRINITY_DN186_c0_g1_i2.p1 TRINITY_DN186_c0_g1~~TRINITY_DN186_c0_g1_i2.p1  ORF type:complete len:206 (-),score=77.12 TRINITY_DN186_c0_g1_i2:593-1210(-)